MDNSIKLVKGDAEIATWELGGNSITFIFNMKSAPEDIVLELNGTKAECHVNAHDCAIQEWSNKSKQWYNIFF